MDSWKLRKLIEFVCLYFHTHIYHLNRNIHPYYEQLQMKGNLRQSEMSKYYSSYCKRMFWNYCRTEIELEEKNWKIFTIKEDKMAVVRPKELTFGWFSINLTERLSSSTKFVQLWMITWAKKYGFVSCTLSRNKILVKDQSLKCNQSPDITVSCIKYTRKPTNIRG